MYRTSLILIALLTALGTVAAQQISPDCSTDIPEPRGHEQSFPIAKGENIPKDTTCKWAIKETSPLNLMVYLRVDGATTQTQCVTVDNKQPNNPKQICGKLDQNTFISNGQEVTVTYTYTGESASMPNFMVMYRFANSAHCTVVSPMATESEQSFQILNTDASNKQTTFCSWIITTTNQQKIVVRVGADGCISVSNKPSEAGKQICGNLAENTFISEGQEVTVTYYASSADVKNFQVFYKTENSKECSTNIPDASAMQQSFPIATTATISKGTQCMWPIKAASSRKILVYLTANGTSTETQCITVDNKPSQGSKQICGKPNENTFTSTGSEVTVTYNYTGESASMPNFMVMYRFANSEVCTVASPMATENEQSFEIIKTPETIPNNAYCSWTITAPSPQRVMVHLTTEGTTTENQCVSVSNNPQEAGQKICGKPNENTFTSEGQQLTVTYPSSQPATDVKNFKVFYKASDARRDTAWIAGILSVYILSQLLL